MSSHGGWYGIKEHMNPGPITRVKDTTFRTPSKMLTSNEKQTK